MPLNQPSNINSGSAHKVWWLVAVLYCFSGLTSLAYEVLWSRMLSMQFGVSIFGVVLTVAAFMLGLGSGSLAGIKWAKQSKEPITIFAVLEIGIAIYALLLPLLLRSSNGWMEGVASQLTLLQWYLLQGAGAFCLLLIPAFAMGAGFALVLKTVEQTPISLGKIYGLNTLGGVAGAIFPLWSLPAIGWTDSVRIMAMVGMGVGISALAVSRSVNRAKPLLQEKENRSERPPISALMVYAGIGAGSIMLEIGWVRLYGMIMLRTEYVLGLILAVFLLGIALGSMFLPRLKKYGLSAFMPFVIGGGVLLGLLMLPATSAWIEQSDFKSFFWATTYQALILGVFTLPITLALGAWLPLMASRYDDAESSGVWLYGANCLGGSAGAVIACLIFIPLLGSVGMVALCAVAITALGLIWVKSRWAWLGFAFMLVAAWSLRTMPPVHELLPRIEADSRNLYLYEDAISLTHVVQQPDGQRVLLSDLQRMDASTDPSAVEIQKDQARLALLLHPAPKSVLFLGLGTGISAAGSKPFPSLIRSAVELSQGSINSAKYLFSPVNGNILDQVQIQRDDARHFLSSTQRHYDVIVGDLFHPDIAGMGSLLSVQQFERAKNRLNRGGVFVQWLALNQFEIESLKVVLRSFQHVYPNAQLFMDGMHLALVGPENEFSGANAILQNLERMNPAEQSQATGAEGAWTWIGRYWGPIDEMNGPLQDEWEPYIEYKLPRARYDGNVNLANLMLWLLQRHPEPEAAMRLLAIDANDKSKFGRDYVATELTVRAWVLSIQGDAAKAGNLIWLAYQANPRDRWIANSLADSMWQSLTQAKDHGLSERDALQRIIKVYPDHVGALRALWHLESTEGKPQAAEQYRSRLLANSPLDSEAKSIQ
ncbi:spermidine synthase [mine drainage metagenome]|uniref:Spermidine synthase n=1 Tax=mine drainage metagenome TaxID=410659 RepID=A0A1J5TBN5_9ZZZZ